MMAFDVAGLVKEIRRTLDLTQEELAPLLKVSLPTISRWETGRSRPDAMALHVIEQFLRRRSPECAPLLSRYFGKGSAPRRASRRRSKATQTALSLDGSDNRPTAPPLDTKSMEGMLWKAACSIRGEKDAPKFKDYTPPPSTATFRRSWTSWRPSMRKPAGWMQS